MKTTCFIKTALAFSLLLALCSPAPAVPFTIIALPDTQVYNKTANPNLMDGQAEWIVANKEPLNIVFVSQFGDFTDDGTKAEYWKHATAAIDKLDAKVPYSVSFGNHDLREKEGPVNSRAFLTKAHQGGPAFGGASKDGLSCYQIFSGGGFKFLHLNLSFSPSPDTLTWADGVVKANPKMPVIVTTHCYLNIDGNRTPAKNEVWNNLVAKNPRIFMVLCGHFHGEAQRLGKNEAGLNVIQMLADYQNDPKGGNGWLRQITFKPEEGRIHFKTYSPYLKTFRDGLNSDFSFDAAFDASNNSIVVLGQTGLPPDALTPCIVKKVGPRNLIVSEGKPVSLSVKADGTPPLFYQWRKNGKDIPGATSTEYKSRPLKVKEAPVSFSVCVSNVAGSVMSPSCTVNVTVPPGVAAAK